MLFKVGEEIIDTDKVPVALIFVDKEEARTVGNIISNIKNGDTKLPTDENGNWWFMMPAGPSKEENDKWSTLSSEQKQLLKTRARVTGKLLFEL